ncbi:MAG TPA: DoxX family protein [Acetobacteraceae bacterium]|nr:DoxX family protein [Acetobacteraceae bacterium]
MQDADRWLTLVGRILLAWIFVMAGFGKLMSPGATIGYFGSIGLPVPVAAYAVALFVEILVGLALLVGYQTRVSALILAVWCILTAITAHSNFANRDMMIHFMKNFAMAGGLLFVAAHGAGAISLDAARLRRRGSAPA